MSGKEDYIAFLISIIILLSAMIVAVPGISGDMDDGRVFIAKSSGDHILDVDGDSIDDSISIDSDYPIPALVHIDSRENMNRGRIELGSMAHLTGEEINLIPVIFTVFQDHDSVLEVANLPYVDLIELDRVLTPAQNISVRSLKAASSTVYSPNTAHDLGYTGDGVVIAVIDGGVDNEHPTFDGAFAAGVDFTLQDTSLTPRDGSLDPDDTNGHGTGVASVALGRGDVSGNFKGVAPGAGLIDLRIRRNGPTLAGPMSQAVEWCIYNKDTDWGNGYVGVDIISISAGLGEEGSIVPQLITEAVSEGLTVISAATNSGTSFEDNTNSADYWADDSIIIGGTDDKDTIDRSDDEHWTQSTWGPRTDDGDDDPYDELKPDVVAPAYNIIFAADSKTSDINPADGWNIGSGTSYATPAASGIAALVLEANPDLVPGEDWNPIRELFHQTAEARGDIYNPDLSEKYNIYFGYGVLDAYEAVMLADDFSEENKHPRIVEFHVEPAVTTPGSICSVTGRAMDEDGDTLKLILESSDGGISGEPGNWNWTAPEMTGRFTLTFRAEDPEGLFDEDTVEVEVVDIIENHPPSIESIETTCDRIPVGESCTIEVSAYDTDGDDLEYGYDSSDGTIEGSGSRVIYHSPGYQGVFMITVIVEDPKGAQDTDFIQIVVFEEIINPPMIQRVYLEPTVIEAYDEDSEVLLMAHVIETNSDLDMVYADLYFIGGEREQILLDDGFSPDDVSNDGIYTYELTLLDLLDPGIYDIMIYAVDINGMRAGPTTVQLTVNVESIDDPDDDDGNNTLSGDSNTGNTLWIKWQVLLGVGIILAIAVVFATIYLFTRRRRESL